MRSRFTYLAVALLLLGTMGLFAWINPSYQKAFEAKWYYFTGKYDEAYRLAKEAYEADPYNRMALTMMTRAQWAKKYLDYIKEGLGYLHEIEKIADRSPVSEADRLRIKWMCEVMIGRYERLASTPLTDEELEERAHGIYEKFVSLYEQLFKQK